ncbi:MAG: DUF4199 domain-containing protein, partial [Bacteroidia bacterium]|nr:DUF4199 domain-containing protein [Bacteroidia bacterium]
MENYKPAISRGITMGVIGILVFLVIYAIDPFLFAKPAGWITSLAINFIALPIVFMILAARDCKPNFSPYNFGKAFNAAFFTGVVSALIALVFSVIFTMVIDITWEQGVQEAALESTQELMEKMGAPDESIEEAMEQAKVKMEESPKGIMAQLIRTG